MTATENAGHVGKGVEVFCCYTFTASLLIRVAHVST